MIRLAGGFGRPSGLLLLANLLLVVTCAILLWPRAPGWMIVTGGIVVFLFSCIGTEHTLVVFLLLVTTLVTLLGHRFFVA